MATEPDMGRPAPRWGHLAFLATVAGYAAWYAADAYMASAKLQNLILIVPGAALCIGLAAGLAYRELRPAGAPAATSDDTTGSGENNAVTAEESVDERIPPVLLAMLAVYVVAMAWIGFDIATFLFVGAALYLLGQRNWALILGYSTAFTFAVVAGMGQLVSLPEMYVLGWALP